jgi:hypothetical protein
MITSSRKLQGKPFKTGSQGCDGFGLLLVAILWTGESFEFENAEFALITDI